MTNGLTMTSVKSPQTNGKDNSQHYFRGGGRTPSSEFPRSGDLSSEFPTSNPSFPPSSDMFSTVPCPHPLPPLWQSGMPCSPTHFPTCLPRMRLPSYLDRIRIRSLILSLRIYMED